MSTVTLDIIIIVVCIGGLWLGGNLVVDSATRIARKIGMSDLIIGLTVVAIGTSAPEFAVTIGAALQGSSDISVGNVVGSNIFNLGFILGGLALIRGVPTSRILVFRDGSVLIATTLLLAFFMRDLNLSQTEGIILIVLLVTYVGYLIFQRSASEEELTEGEFRWFDILIFIGGVAIVVGSGHFFVEAASSLARIMGISEWVIGVTIVAVGTSAPEIATSAIALIRGQHGMSAGNLIGSDLFNLLGVLGLAAILQPMTVDPAAQTSVFILVAVVALVVVMMRTGWRLSRWEGGLLVAITLVRWILDFMR